MTPSVLGLAGSDQSLDGLVKQQHQIGMRDDDMLLERPTTTTTTTTTARRLDMTGQILWMDETKNESPSSSNGDFPKSPKQQQHSSPVITTWKVCKRKNETIGLGLCKYKRKDGIYINRILKGSKVESSAVLRLGMKVVNLNHQACPSNVPDCISKIAKTHGWLTIHAQDPT